MIIAIDVDGTVVDTHTLWDKWLRKRGSSYSKISGKSGEELRYLGFDYLEFWKNPTLYDNLEPIKNCDWIIHQLKQNGNKIIFVSACFEEHEESKRKFLEKYFEFDAFISTPHKEFILCDYFIDDYNGYLDKATLYNKNVKAIKIKSALNSPNPKYPYMSWDELKEYFEIEGLL